MGMRSHLALAVWCAVLVATLASCAIGHPSVKSQQRLDVPRALYLAGLSHLAPRDETTPGVIRNLAVYQPGGDLRVIMDDGNALHSARLDGTGEQVFQTALPCYGAQMGFPFYRFLSFDTLAVSRDSQWLACNPHHSDLQDPQSLQTLVLSKLGADGGVAESHLIVLPGADRNGAMAWSPDGRYLALVRVHEGSPTISVFRHTSEWALTPVHMYVPEIKQEAATDVYEYADQVGWSPDGKTLHVRLWTLADNSHSKMTDIPWEAPAVAPDTAATSVIPALQLLDKPQFNCLASAWSPTKDLDLCRQFNGGNIWLADPTSDRAGALLFKVPDSQLITQVAWLPSGSDFVFVVNHPNSDNGPLYNSDVYLYTMPTLCTAAFEGC